MNALAEAGRIDCLLPMAFADIKCWLDAFLGFLYPEACQYCGNERATVTDGYIGTQCQTNVTFIEPPYCQRCGLPFPGAITAPFECANCREMELHFSQARSAVVAKGMALELIHRYKYHRALWLEPCLAQWLITASQPHLHPEHWDMIVPVPLHSLKEREREFNQAERLARRLGLATNLPVHSRLLRRSQPTRTQTRLSRSERADNVRRAFTLAQPECARDQRIVLLDDVLTTGATASACARLLRQAGARNVCVWTLARGLLH